MLLKSRFKSEMSYSTTPSHACDVCAAHVSEAPKLHTEERLDLLPTLGSAGESFPNASAHDNQHKFGNVIKVTLLLMQPQ